MGTPADLVGLIGGVNWLVHVGILPRFLCATACRLAARAEATNMVGMRVLLEELQRRGNWSNGLCLIWLRMIAYYGLACATQDLVGDDHSTAGFTSLHIAALYSSFEVVQYLVEEAGADVEATDDAGITPLGHACRKGRVDVVRYLVESAKAKTTSDHAMRAPYTIAAIAKQTKVMRYLRDDAHVRVDPHVEFVVRVLPALAATDANRLRGILSEGGPSSVRRVRRAAWEACIDKGDVRGVTALIRAGADVNKLCMGRNGGLTSVHCAAEMGQHAIVRLMVLEASADVESRASGASYAGMTALDDACMQGHLSIVQLLVEQGKAKVQCPAESGNAARSALTQAATYGRLEIVKYLVKKARAEVNAVACHGGKAYTAVQCACISGHVDVVRYLITEAGASYSSATNLSGDFNPLWIAVTAGHVEMVECLLQEGHYTEPDPQILCMAAMNDDKGVRAESRDVSIVRTLVTLFGRRFTDDNYALAMRGACLSSKDEMVRLLLRSGGLVAAAASVAAEYGRGDLLVEMLEREQLGKSPCAFSELLSTALRVACQNAQLAVLERLIQLWRPKYFGSEYSKALTYAAEKGDLVAVRILAAAGVEPRTARTRDGSALELARKKGHIEITRFISGYTRSRVVRSGRHRIGRVSPPPPLNLPRTNTRSLPTTLQRPFDDMGVERKESVEPLDTAVPAGDVDMAGLSQKKEDDPERDEDAHAGGKARSIRRRERRKKAKAVLSPTEQDADALKLTAGTQQHAKGMEEEESSHEKPHDDQDKSRREGGHEDVDDQEDDGNVDNEEWLLKHAPDDLICPVSLVLMTDPEGQELRSPVSGLPMDAVFLTNVVMRSQVMDFVETKMQQRQRRRQAKKINV